jgi:hypothetical protein
MLAKCFIMILVETPGAYISGSNSTVCSKCSLKLQSLGNTAPKRMGQKGGGMAASRRRKGRRRVSTDARGRPHRAMRSQPRPYSCARNWCRRRRGSCASPCASTGPGRTRRWGGVVRRRVESRGKEVRTRSCRRTDMSACRGPVVPGQLARLQRGQSARTSVVSDARSVVTPTCSLPPPASVTTHAPIM